MEEFDNKKKSKLFLVGLIALLVIVIGATYAYFAVTTVSNFGTSIINATAGEIGSVTLNGNNANLSLSVTALDMVQGSSDITYYASSSGTTTTQTEETIGTATLTPSTDTSYYHCTYTLSVTHTGTNDMYTVFSSATNKSAGQLILTINGVDYDFNDGWPTNNQVTGEFYVTSGSSANITAGLRLINDSDINQNYLANTDIQISISLVNNSLSCTVYEPASKSIIALTEDSSNASKISKYTGPVTDECGANSCTTVNSAQNVYYITSNDINNVIFEDYCWKIIRTTETGGVKLLYNGLPSNGECNNSCDDRVLSAVQLGRASDAAKVIRFNSDEWGHRFHPAYVGYMYNPSSLNSTYYNQLRGDNLNVSDSYLKRYTENWYSNSNINSGKLEDAVYCNDRSLASTSTITEAQLPSATSGGLTFTNTYFNSATLECSLITDSFNTTNVKAKTNYKVGFLTTPEADLITSTVYADSFIFWSGSPASYVDSGNTDPYPSIRYYSGSCSGGYGDTAYYGVRPVVSASPGVKITDGTGSTTDPFIFE